MVTPDDQERFEPHGLEPSYGSWMSIAHYYGDAVRQLFLGAAALMILTSPLYADSLRVQFPFIVVGALLAVTLAALTNPHKRIFCIVDCVLAGVAVLVYAMWGIAAYEQGDPIAFVLLLAIAAIFLFAFYFALKTVRAFSLHQIGKWSTNTDFQRSLEEDEEDAASLGSMRK